MQSSSGPSVEELHSQEVDQRVFLDGVSFELYEGLVASRGESAVPRLTYLDGTLEIMSPSTHHERIKTVVARLLEAWAEEHDIELSGVGSWTVKRKRKRGGLEPDECYIVGPRQKPRPDIAIEVIWTHGGLDKLEIYRRLGVFEVWVWQDDRIQIHLLRGYVPAQRSKLLPHLNLAELMRFIDPVRQTAAVRAYRAALRRSSS